ncbi:MULTISPECIES: M20/M25/M40 family metallo-hydrolase [Fusobacterium]|uniref:M20/M25/M40 family metallo-hydrolase n=1 Tax=Fusobacterium TaxID=848 RepID=UPI001F2E5AB6|nr:MULTISPECIES: M20/M25/M40 family metallo-hydrolase [Fusobacterium]MCF2613158.1 M20/M25/M40 family metallo-hydrolase [Fusobacterium perfoetens]MDY2981675.1 M20/M25/M40 family metallo-hydrolase [Fusobacterium sp.]
MQYTINCGVVKGGAAKNVVAEKAFLEFEFRVKKIEEAKEVIKKVEILKEHAKEKEIKVVILGGLNRGPMIFDEKSKVLFELIKSKGKELDIEIKGVSSGGASDGNLTSSVGSPTIDGLGPVGGGQHSTSEYLDLDSVEERINLLVKVIEGI